MAAAQIPGEDPTATAPVACSLTPAGLADQAGRWARLAARAMTGREQTGRGIRIGFRPGPGTEEELRALVAVETRCCPWATWTVHADGAQLVLDVRSAGPDDTRMSAAGMPDSWGTLGLSADAARR